MTRRQRKPQPPAEDPDLFQGAMVDVTRLPHHGKVEFTPPRPRPIPAQRMRDEKQTLIDSLREPLSGEASLEMGEALVYARSGIGPQILRKLRRGHWILQDELDLHGDTVEEARDRLAAFLASCVRRGLRCVRIVHGKGLRSRNREPVLKKYVAAWLARRKEILAYCEARAADGGAGAVVVLLEGSRRQER